MAVYGNTVLREGFFNRNKKKKDNKSDYISEEEFNDKCSNIIKSIIDRLNLKNIINNEINSLKMEKYSKCFNSIDIGYDEELGYAIFIICKLDLYDFRNCKMKDYNARDVEVCDALEDELYNLCDKVKNKVKSIPDGIKIVVDDTGDWDDFNLIIRIEQSYLKSIIS